MIKQPLNEFADSMLTFDEIRFLEAGDIFYECEYGLNIEAKVIKKPVAEYVEIFSNKPKKLQYKWEAVNTKNGATIDYLMTESLVHYGPRLYKRPQYITIENGISEFKFI